MKFDNSVRMGRYMGPVLSLLILSEIINYRIWKIAADPQLVYLNGFILLLLGFYVIRNHNKWVMSWPVIITLSGWFFSILGLLRMFFPEAKQAGDSIYIFIGLGAIFLTEVYLTFKAYSSNYK